MMLQREKTFTASANHNLMQCSHHFNKSLNVNLVLSVFCERILSQNEKNSHHYSVCNGINTTLQSMLVSIKAELANTFL